MVSVSFVDDGTGTFCLFHPTSLRLVTALGDRALSWLWKFWGPVARRFLATPCLSWGALIGSSWMHELGYAFGRLGVGSAMAVAAILAWLLLDREPGPF